MSSLDLGRLIPAFLDRRAQELVELREAFGEERWETVRFIAHRLKGSGGLYGFHDLTSLAAGLEKAAISEEKTRIADLLGELESWVSATRESVTKSS